MVFLPAGVYQAVGCANGSDPLTYFGCTPTFQGGTRLVRNQFAPNIIGSTTGTRFTGAATAKARNGVLLGPNAFWRGNGAGLGGFKWYGKMWLETIDAAGPGANRFFMGLWNGSAVSDPVAKPEEPSTLLTDFVGIGFDGTDANVQLWSGDSVTANKIDLGAARTDPFEMFELSMSCAPSDTFIQVHVERVRITRTVLFDGPLTVNLPRPDRGMNSVFETGTGSGPGAIPVHTFCVYEGLGFQP